MTQALGGIVGYNKWLMALDLLLIFWFLYGWYNHYRKTGGYIDFWYYNMFLFFFVPVLIMYPFDNSDLNILSVLGLNNLYIIQDHSSEAFIVSLTGFSCAYVGKYLFDKEKPFVLIELMLIPFSNYLGRFYISIVKNPLISRGFILSYIVVLIGFLFFIVSSGLMKNPREFFMLNTKYMPIYILIISTFEIAFIIISIRSLQFNNNIDKTLFGFLVVFGFFLGVRAPIILQGISFGVFYIMYKRNGYISLTKVMTAISVILFLVMLLAYIRNSTDETSTDPSLVALSFIAEIFYGNTFSDVRDFSWVLGNWNREYYLGRSYLAAFLSFIPSSLYPIRETWGIGKLTVRAAGLDETTHPGLRMGVFGEMYLNFGIIGVALFGIIWGYILRRVDYFTKKYTSQGNVVKASSVIVYSSFISYLTGSAGTMSFYIIIFLLAALSILSRMRLDT
ncbi:O-antigen polymerase [uncultured Fibrella sp.]|uniref:O-antigen polymerase n=1 Tax=uncultured Fibrella sp. TaxID=1284596 RepID=UPI0035CB629E